MRYQRNSSKSGIVLQDLYALKLQPVWQAVKYEGWSFKWLCIYFLFEYVRPASIYPQLDILPWTQLSLLFAVFSAFLDKKAVWVRNAGNVLIVLFFIVVLLSSVFAFRSSVSWDMIDIAVNWVIVYFLIVTVINTRQRLFLFLLLFLLVNLKMSAHGFLSFAGRGFTYTKWGVVGPPGWFGDSGDFGIAMLVYIGIAIGVIVANRHLWGRYKRLFFYYMPFTGMMTVIGTSSRGALLGMLAMGAWFLMKSRNGIKALVLFSVVAALLYAVLPDEMFQEFESAGEDSTSQDRLVHWEFGLEVIKRHPLLGVGYENWLAYCNYVNPNGLGFNDRCRLPHNTYISAGSELGLVGLFLYVSLVLYLFRLNARTRKVLAQKPESLLYYCSYGLDAGLVGYLVASVFFTVLFYPIFWVQFGLTVAIHRLSVEYASGRVDNKAASA